MGERHGGSWTEAPAWAGKLEAIEHGRRQVRPHVPLLPKVCDEQVVKDIMPSADQRAPSLERYAPHGGDADIPVEFSVAAYRFGHSMVRPS